jgi:hypothetical protein
MADSSVRILILDDDRAVVRAAPYRKPGKHGI